jgi:predicted dehydrogenase
VNGIDRRSLLGGIAAASGAAVLAPSAARAATAAASTPGENMALFAKPPMKRVRFGIIGVGMRGGELLRLLLGVDGAVVTALCDIDPTALGNAAKLVSEKTGRKPALYGDSPQAYQRLIERADVDAVMIVTPWQWHFEMAKASMLAGKETFVEVPVALNVDDCWELVELSEKLRVRCMMLENCCYDYGEMFALNMVRAGLLGELTHAEGGYIHNLRWLLDDMSKGEGSWRPEWYTQRTANAYPTHGLGPIANYFDINRGDRLDYLVSMNSPARGFAAAAREKAPEGDPRRAMKFTLSDMNSTLIQTARGRTISLQHDVQTPRPYSRINLVQGTGGIFAGYPDRLALSSVHEGEEWIADLAPYQEKYEPRLWKQLRTEAASMGGGHGGMDYIMLWRVVHCLKTGLPLDQSIYDAVDWSILFDLSEQSALNRSKPIDFPDFTRGRWKTTPRVEFDNV